MNLTSTQASDEKAVGDCSDAVCAQVVLDKFQKVFMADDGSINDTAKLEKFVKAIRATDKRSDLKCFYTQMLKKSNKTILEKFISKDIGGWKIIKKWFAEAVDADDDDLLIDVLDLINKVPFQSFHVAKSKDKAHKFGSFMKKLQKQNNPEVAKLAKSIYKRIQKLSCGVDVKKATNFENSLVTDSVSQTNISVNNNKNLTSNTTASDSINQSIDCNASLTNTPPLVNSSSPHNSGSFDCSTPKKDLVDISVISEKSIRSILMSADKGPKKRQRKSITWRSDSDIRQIRYFENVEDERCNVSYQNERAIQAMSRQNASSSSNSFAPSLFPSTHNSPQPLPGSSSSNDPRNDIRGQVNDYNRPWRLILIELSFEVKTPGMNSRERGAQAERESSVLCAIDLPGQLSTLDEPDQVNKSPTCEAVIIPLENDDMSNINDYSNQQWNTEYNQQIQQQMLPQPQQAQVQMQPQQQINLPFTNMMEPQSVMSLEQQQEYMQAMQIQLAQQQQQQQQHQMLMQQSSMMQTMPIQMQANPQQMQLPMQMPQMPQFFLNMPMPMHIEENLQFRR